jgi:hypothetical protein
VKLYKIGYEKTMTTICCSPIKRRSIKLTMPFNRPGAKVCEGIIRNWWRQGMMCSMIGAHDCIKAFSETDFTDDLR